MLRLSKKVMPVNLFLFFYFLFYFFIFLFFYFFYFLFYFYFLLVGCLYKVLSGELSPKHEPHLLSVQKWFKLGGWCPKP